MIDRQHVLNRKLLLPLFGSLALAMQQLCSTRSIRKTYLLEIGAWHEEMGNATGATGRAGVGKLATVDASPSWSRFIQ